MFKVVDQHWKNNLINAKKGTNVLDFCNDEELRDLILEDIQVLNKVFKNLEN